LLDDDDISISGKLLQHSDFQMMHSFGFGLFGLTNDEVAMAWHYAVLYCMGQRH
jgi:hypothetical protein